MPLNSSQLAELVNRARHKAVASPPPPPSPAAQRPVRSRQAAPVSQAPSTARIEPRTGALTLQPNDAVASPALSPPPPPSPAPQSEHAAEDFPFGWELTKESWHFHRRFYAVFKRPMERGEYRYLLKQIRFGHAEHLGENCWRVTLPSSGGTLQIRGSSSRLITILPKNWQPTPGNGPSSPAPPTGAVPPH